MELDLASLASVRKFASEYNSLGLPLNLLIYSPMTAYGQSKLANILHTNEFTRRFKEEGVNITANSLHPGCVATNLFRHHIPPLIAGVVVWIAKHFIKDNPQRRHAMWLCIQMLKE